MKNTNEFKNKLEAEKLKLLGELKTVGREKPGIPGEWEATVTDLETDAADENMVADEIEEFEENSGVVEKLEAQLKAVNLALEKIKEGTYGKCSVCSAEIPNERLMANPAATTCVSHAK